MAAKTVQQAIFNAFEKEKTIVTAKLMGKMLAELRDMAAHRTMIIGEGATAMDLFNDLFGDIPAIKNGGDK